MIGRDAIRSRVIIALAESKMRVKARPTDKVRCAALAHSGGPMTSTYDAQIHWSLVQSMSRFGHALSKRGFSARPSLSCSRCRRRPMQRRCCSPAILSTNNLNLLPIRRRKHAAALRDASEKLRTKTVVRGSTSTGTPRRLCFSRWRHKGLHNHGLFRSVASGLQHHYTCRTQRIPCKGRL